MTGTRWWPVLDHGSDEYRVRLRDALWGGIATLRDASGKLLDPLAFKSREEAFAWLRVCAEYWDDHPNEAPAREASLCANCDQRTGRPIRFQTGESVSGPGMMTRDYCPTCASVRLTPVTLAMLRRLHESVCTRCRRGVPHCYERTTIVEAFEAAYALRDARNLDG